VHPYTAAVVGHLEDTRAKLRGVVDAVPAQLRGRRPADDRWSVNDVLEHLSLVESLFTKRISDAIATAREAGLGPELAAERVPLAENIGVVVEDRVTRRTAPEPARPTGALDSAAAWQAVEQSRRRLVDTLLANDGLALSEVFTTHPAFGAMTIYQTIEFIAHHEARHRAQIVEVAGQLAQA